MEKLTLRFLNSSEETLYQKLKRPFMVKNLYHYFKLQMGFFIVMILVALIKQNFVLNILFSSIGFLAFLLIFFLLKKHIRKIFFESFIIIFCSGIGIFLVEFIKMAQTNGNIDVASVVTALFFQFYLTIILLTKMSWINCSLVFLGNLVYFLIRLVQVNTNYPEEIYIGSTLLLLNFSIISYRNEKTSREYFKNLQDSNDNLRKFKEIMQTILPNPIFILNYEEDKIKFSNNSANKLYRKNTTRIITESFSEKNLLSNEKNMISLKILEEALDNFTILNQDSSYLTENSNKPLLSEVMKKFNLAFKNNDDLLENDIKEEFSTLNVFKGKANNDQIKVLEDKNNQILFSKNKYYEVKLCNIHWEGNDCLLIIFNDQTKAKRVLELINLNKYKNQILATISHNLRTPLNGVIGMMTTVFSALLDRENKENLMIGIRSAHLLNYLINDILDFSQISYKKLRMNIGRIKILDLISEIYDLMKLQAKQKKINFSREIFLDHREIIYSDPIRIKQILLNLLGNAIKYTNEGGSIILKVEGLIENDDLSIRFSIIDTGIGIKADEIGKLFVLFGKLKQENPEINKTGIGFGLTLSQNLAKMLYSGKDAGISVESEDGKGSTFSFKVNIGKKELEDFSFIEEKSMPEINEKMLGNIKRYESCGIIEEKLSSKHESAKSLIIPKKILVVDDDPVNVMILEKYLQFFKLDYFSATNGLEAVNFIENEVIQNNKEISAILMDCNMPILDGFKATERIIELLKKNKKNHIPIIAITANVSNADVDLCFKSGMIKFLAKPVKRKDLGLTLQYLLKLNHK